MNQGGRTSAFVLLVKGCMQMETIIAQGGERLRGEITVHGAKNSALPILAACVLCGKESVIHNCPRLTDVDAAIKILLHLGCKVTRENRCITVDSSDMNKNDIPDELMREMRSSVVFLGPVLARMGEVHISAPGGCEIGLRPIDLHLEAMKRLGASVDEEHGRINFLCPGKLKGNKITLSFPSVGATENIMLAAATAKGRTVVVNAAREPEISDLADFLNGCGAHILGAGEGTLVIDGVERLYGTEHTVIPDRIAAATFLSAAAATHGRIVLHDVIPAHIAPVLPALEETGCDIQVRSREISLSAPPKLHRIRTVRTMPYPGFPTDAQAPVMAAACVAEGTSVFIENIFESRYKHVSELIRLGANIKVEGRMAVIEGVSYLSGAPVVAPDLRGGSALIIAGLCARGETRISGIYHIDRGYENIEESLRQIGAKIRRVENEQSTAAPQSDEQYEKYKQGAECFSETASSSSDRE